MYICRYGDPDVPGTGACVDYDRATACKTFNQPTTPCLYSCPRLIAKYKSLRKDFGSGSIFISLNLDTRVYLESTGVGQESQARRLGCFRC